MTAAAEASLFSKFPAISISPHRSVTSLISGCCPLRERRTRLRHRRATRAKLADDVHVVGAPGDDGRDGGDEVGADEAEGAGDEAVTIALHRTLRRS
jgi:hypothetical protein